jgi:hypothetical protein
MNTQFKDIEEAIAAQAIAQTIVINENSDKGDALEYALNAEGVEDFIVPNTRKLLHSDSPEEARAAALNVLNYTLFYMINRGLL